MAAEPSHIATDQEFMRVALPIANRVIAKIRQAPAQGDATEAMVLLLTRVTNSSTSIGVLLDRSPLEADVDCATILRAMYDAMLQGLYILREPACRQERARLFLDYAWIERHRLMELLDRNPTSFAVKLRASPFRAKGEPEIRAQFEHIRSRYLTNKGGIRDAWYKGTLRDLAREVGLEDEYEVLQRILSSVVHSTPLAMRHGPNIRGSHLRTFAWQAALRLLGAVADFTGVALDAEEGALLHSFRRSILAT